MISQGHGGAFRDVALHHKKALLFPIFCNTLLHQAGGFSLVLVVFPSFLTLGHIFIRETDQNLRSVPLSGEAFP